MPSIKVVVWDADNTLWDGTAYYTDREAVTLKPGTRAALKELTKRGIVNTMCSRNNYDDVDVLLRRFEIAEYFREPQIGWGLKSDAIRRLAEIFGCAFTEMLFIDDDTFQRAEVQSQLPTLNIINVRDPIDVLACDGVRLDRETAEDRSRVQLLKASRDREVAETSARGRNAYREFLRACAIRMVVRDIEDRDWDRVVQLLNRTNELNATGNRYHRDELREEFIAGHLRILVAELTDSFGDYGLIAETIIDMRTPGEWLLRDITVSCRTMGRGIGGALIVAALTLSRDAGIATVRGYTRKTESNWRMQPLFEKRGFTKISVSGDTTWYAFDVWNAIAPYPDWLTVDVRVPAPSASASAWT